MQRVRIRHEHWLPQLLGINGITLYPFILLAGRNGMLPRTLYKHEMIHIEQVRTVGFVRFYLSYLLYYLAARVEGLRKQEAYYQIPYEKEAYKAQAEPLDKEELSELEGVIITKRLAK